MRVTTTHEDKARPRAGRSSRCAEVTAGDIGKDHVSQGSGLLYFPTILGKKTLPMRYKTCFKTLLDGVPQWGRGGCLKSASQTPLCYQLHRYSVHEVNEDGIGGD